jgi:hypothetical protein
LEESSDGNKTTKTEVRPLTTDEDNDKTTPMGLEARQPNILKSENRRDSVMKEFRINIDLINSDGEHCYRQRGRSALEKGEKVAVPPFLQIKTLHAGSIFVSGLLSRLVVGVPFCMLVSPSYAILTLRLFLLRYPTKSGTMPQVSDRLNTCP